jgi:hypothetical protein
VRIAFMGALAGTRRTTAHPVGALGGRGKGELTDRKASFLVENPPPL